MTLHLPRWFRDRDHRLTRHAEAQRAAVQGMDVELRKLGDGLDVDMAWLATMHAAVAGLQGTGVGAEQSRVWRDTIATWDGRMVQAEAEGKESLEDYLATLAARLDHETEVLLDKRQRLIALRSDLRALRAILNEEIALAQPYGESLAETSDFLAARFGTPWAADCNTGLVAVVAALTEHFGGDHARARKMVSLLAEAGYLRHQRQVHGATMTFLPGERELSEANPCLREPTLDSDDQQDAGMWYFGQESLPSEDQ
ncbi:hypothetical protein [Acidithiobacillus sp.]